MSRMLRNPILLTLSALAMCGSVRVSSKSVETFEDLEVRWNAGSPDTLLWVAEDGTSTVARLGIPDDYRGSAEVHAPPSPGSYRLVAVHNGVRGKGAKVTVTGAPIGWTAELSDQRVDVGATPTARIQCLRCPEDARIEVGRRGYDPVLVLPVTGQTAEVELPTSSTGLWGLSVLTGDDRPVPRRDERWWVPALYDVERGAFSCEVGRSGDGPWIAGHEVTIEGQCLPTGEWPPWTMLVPLQTGPAIADLPPEARNHPTVLDNGRGVIRLPCETGAMELRIYDKENQTQPGAVKRIDIIGPAPIDCEAGVYTVALTHEGKSAGVEVAESSWRVKVRLPPGVEYRYAFAPSAKQPSDAEQARPVRPGEHWLNPNWNGERGRFHLWSVDTKTGTSQLLVRSTQTMGEETPAEEAPSTEPTPEEQFAASMAMWQGLFSDPEPSEEPENPRLRCSGDCTDGFGIATFLPDGPTVESHWVNHKAEGEGVVTWPDGKRYEGTLVDGHLSGQGTCTLPDGYRITGTFANDEPIEGTYGWYDSVHFRGRFENWKPTGDGWLLEATAPLPAPVEELGRWVVVRDEYGNEERIWVPLGEEVEELRGVLIE